MEETTATPKMLDHILQEDVLGLTGEEYKDRIVIFLRDSTQQIQMPVNLGKNKQGKDVVLPGIKNLPEQLQGTIVKATERVVHFSVKDSHDANIIPYGLISRLAILSAIKAAPPSRIISA